MGTQLLDCLRMCTKHVGETGITQTASIRSRERHHTLGVGHSHHILQRHYPVRRDTYKHMKQRKVVRSPIRAAQPSCSEQCMQQHSATHISLNLYTLQ
jgi:hypothetical protein